LRKVEDDIAGFSKLDTDYQSAWIPAGALGTASAKFFGMTDRLRLVNRNPGFPVFTTLEVMSGILLWRMCDSDFPGKPNLNGFMSFSCTGSDYRFRITTCIVNYCISKAENYKNLNYKIIPNCVSNNCLVLTYN
jgi:hypothetical protein